MKGMVIKPRNNAAQRAGEDRKIISDGYTFVVNGTAIDEYVARCNIVFEPHAIVKVFLELEFLKGDIEIQGFPVEQEAKPS